MKKIGVYSLQNVAIHEARRQLEAVGALAHSSSLDQVREIAGEINRGIRSISKLSLKQREILIEQLIEKGARVRNPHIYASDLKAETELGGPRKILLFSRVSERQLRMLDSLAAQIFRQNPDSYRHFCLKLFNSPQPRNRDEITRLAAIFRSMKRQQEAKRDGVS